MKLKATASIRPFLLKSRPAVKRSVGFTGVLIALGGVTVGCSDPALEKPAVPSFSARGSVEQVHIWKAPPMAKVELHDAAGVLVQEGTADGLGSLIFRKVAPNDAYEVVIPELSGLNKVSPVRVTNVDDSLPSPDFYKSQKLV